MSEFKENLPQKSNEDLHIGLKVLSFCIPLAGAIIYFVKKENEPVAAKSACNLALIGLGVNVVLTVVRLALTGS
ncbi:MULTISPECIES: hypothetical protein [Chryseobacterium]|jgi:hypothetical protein|uniref:Uncharacterized protein n=1 Tax=Chryseobacterium indoltheticum TaxID=254 RepID=A0A381F9I6_9FLAO|nr:MULTISPECIES: hypothetical protein [Chryseobacterium]AZA60937.1 hypothetical protein EG340_07715 [Chryseobacterium indoltheticum]AZA73411.1 hypothetical protein EG358_06415 [Chryseobacterium indoltheticum]MDF2831360.1 hypothetical protein [Chryseobacterium indoltheticum]MDQ8143858.1 hypothetical protein [Chryseobacterium sp. CFS15]QQQ29984.1 hypothetical protein JJL46_08270 [Chryseobacterium indoltheticum]